MESKAYYIDINRFSAQDSESSQTNIWDYKLNDTLVAPAGSAISIHQAFINQKGITGQSIEIEEDINETIQYYVYLTEDIHPIPVAQTPLQTHGYSPYGRNSHKVNSVNLLNNTDTGRDSLFNVDLNVAFRDLYHPTFVGGCGCPLILSTKPALDGDTLQSVTFCDYTATEADFATNQSVALTNGSATITASNPTEFPTKFKIGTGVAGTGISGGTTIIAIAANRQSATLSANFTGTTGTITNIAYSNTGTNVITFKGDIPTGLSVGSRIVEFSGDIPLNTAIKAINADSVTMKNLATGADVLPTGTSSTATISFYTDPSYYVQPVPTQAFITITKGVYGIEQLVNIINRQLTNQYKTGTEIPISNVESAIANKEYDGLINTNNSGFTRIVTPIQYRQSPNQVKVADVDPAVASANLPTHTFIPALDYAKNLDTFHSIFEPTKINFTNRVNPTHADKGYIAYLQDNNTTCYNTTNNTIEDPSAKGYDSYTPEKYAADYRIGARGLTIGSPEINIQYDTDLSGFSLNNLHANYRIPTHDLMGNENEQAGQIAVGLKRVADILDAAPYTQAQSIFGGVSGAKEVDCDVVSGSNVISGVLKRGTTDSALEFLSVGASITGSGIPANTFITQIEATNEYNQEQAYDFRISNNATETGKKTDVTITPNPISFGNQTAFKNSWERPVSRTGGCIIYNFAKQTAIKFGNNSSVVNDVSFRSHASFEEFFTDKNLAKKIWKTKTLWGKLGFTYDQLNSTDYFEEIVQYNHPVNQKLRGITTDTKLDVSVIPTISTLTNPSDFKPSPVISAATKNITNPQNFNNFDFNTPRTQKTTREYADDSKDTTPYSGDNFGSYAGSRYDLATMVNVVAKPTPITAEQLPTLSQFGYYLITSDLVPTYKDIVSKGDPLGLLGVVAKSNLSNQDFIPKTESDIIQVLNQDTLINNIRVKILNPDLSNPLLNDNSSVILKVAVPIDPPNKSTEGKAKTAKNKKKEKKI